MRNPEGDGDRHVTAREIARKLGLSQSTVSRVLSNAAGYRFSEATRQKVLDEAKRMGYRPHAVGRSLRERRTRVVGFCSRRGNLDARNMFLAEIIGSLQRACSDTGHFLLLYNFSPATPTSEVCGELTSRRIDGLVLHASEDDPLVHLLAERRLPVVTIADRVPSAPSVLCDDRDGMAQVVEHLVQKGHRRIAFLRPDDRLASVEDRAESYRAQMLARGLEPLFISIDYEAAEPALDMILAMSNPPTAVCCWNDVSALVLLSACRRAKVRVPDDLAVTGFDGLFDPRLTVQRLTTVAAHWPDVTRCALDVMARLIRGEEVPRETVIPVQLTEGETT